MAGNKKGLYPYHLYIYYHPSLHRLGFRDSRLLSMKFLHRYYQGTSQLLIVKIKLRKEDSQYLIGSPMRSGIGGVSVEPTPNFLNKTGKHIAKTKESDGDINKVNKYYLRVRAEYMSINTELHLVSWGTRASGHILNL